eukprot:TRINITY_DN26196_c0_g1_i1.p2 TRINITY_DN26196_c0_g1~~TRINITY_DN26196_c0_g1_i1.p2  ORF type:complete len:632 (+),score=155.89 TRINITY_DN26196_c0_g1_i1:78-1973(+)
MSVRGLVLLIALLGGLTICFRGGGLFQPQNPAAADSSSDALRPYLLAAAAPVAGRAGHPADWVLQGTGLRQRAEEVRAALAEVAGGADRARFDEDLRRLGAGHWESLRRAAEGYAARAGTAEGAAEVLQHAQQGAAAEIIAVRSQARAAGQRQSAAESGGALDGDSAAPAAAEHLDPAAAPLSAVRDGPHTFLGGVPQPLPRLTGAAAAPVVLGVRGLERVAEGDWARESPPRRRRTRGGAPPPTPAPPPAAGSVRAFNPSLIEAPAALSRAAGVAAPDGAWLLLLKGAALHSCDLPFGSKPRWRMYTERQHRHKWWSELLWGIAERGPTPPGRLLRYGAIPAGQLRGHHVRRVLPGGQLAGNESRPLGAAVLEDARLFALGGALWATWVATAVPEARDLSLGWGMARTFLSPVVWEGQGRGLSVRLQAERTVQLFFPPHSGRSREKNMHLFADAAGAVWMEYTIEPHVVCALDTATGRCSTPHETSVPALRALAEGGAAPRGGAGLVRIPVGPEDRARLQLPPTTAELMLGVAHLCRAMPGQRSCWMYHSFFYAFDPAPPFPLAALSAEFCLPRAGRAADCPLVDSAQMVIGAALHGGSLIVTYGEQDCEARAAQLPLEAVLRALRPVQR